MALYEEAPKEMPMQAPSLQDLGGLNDQTQQEISPEEAEYNKEFNRTEWKCGIRRLNVLEKWIDNEKAITEYKEDGKNLKTVLDIISEAERLARDLSFIKKILIGAGVKEADISLLAGEAIQGKNGYKFQTFKPTASPIKK